MRSDFLAEYTNRAAAFSSKSYWTEYLFFRRRYVKNVSKALSTLSPKSATVAVFGDYSRRFRQQQLSPNSATIVASVDRA